MDWIKQFVILFMFTSGLAVQSSAGSRSKLQPAERFEFCVARNLSESSIFNEEDKVRMSKIVMETDLRMHKMKADPANAVNSKTMLRLFAAALACVVADCDSSVRLQREKACLIALEACAKSLQEPVGDEVVMEMKKIFSAMNREISTLDAISDNSASVEIKKKEHLEKESKVEKTGEPSKEKIQEKSKERLEETKAEKKEEHTERESEVKARPKRAYVPTYRYEAFSTPLQSNPTLESIIADKLLKSATFNNFFTFGLTQDDAVFFSRSMVSTGMSDYRYDIVDEAVNSVTNAMYRLGSFAGSEDYAYAISRSIASVLAAHELTFYADGLGIGSSLVYQLDGMLKSNQSSSLPLSPSFGTASVSSSVRGLSSPVVSTQTGGMASVQVNPSYVEPSFSIPSNPQNDKIQFQSSLSYFLSQSEIIFDAFCSGPFPGLYEVMNSAFADYGYPIASTVATVVTNSLTMLPTEAACTQYAEVISEIVADIFDNSGIILAADPEAITNKISDLISPNIQSNPPQNPSGFGQQSFGGSEYQLNPSFSDYSYSAPEIPASPVDQYPESAFSSYILDTPALQQNPVLTNSTEFSRKASLPIDQTSSKQDLNLPGEISTDKVYKPEGFQFSTDDAIATNNSWVIVDYPSDVSFATGQTNQSSDFVDIVPPIILEPGPVIPEKIPDDIESGPKSKEVAYSNQTTTVPEMTEVTETTETTTPEPPVTNFQSSTVMVKSEMTTPAPQVALKDAFESQSKLSEFFMKEMSSTLKALNVTSGEVKKQPDTPETSGNPVVVQIPQTADSPPDLENSKPTEISPDPQNKPSWNETSAEVQPSVVAPLQQNGPAVEVSLKAPKPITDEVSALIFAEKVSSIVTSSVYLIRSQNLQSGELCNKLNELAPLVDLPPLDVCSEIPLIDYLLHVLNAVTYSLAGEK